MSSLVGQQCKKSPVSAHRHEENILVIKTNTWNGHSMFQAGEIHYIIQEMERLKVSQCIGF